MTEYKTIAAYAADEFTERKSRFIGHISPAETEEQALAFVQEMRTKHRDATHNVFAFILRGQGIRRCSDDGEPQGTGGVPVLDVLEREGLVNACVVVTRYYGGILLGTGGLVRAYSHGAKLAVDAAKIVHMAPCSVLRLSCDYSFYGKLMNLLPDYRAAVLESDFGVLVTLRLLMRSELREAFIKEVTDLSAALVAPELLEEKFADMA